MSSHLAPALRDTAAHSVDPSQQGGRAEPAPSGPGGEGTARPVSLRHLGRSFGAAAARSTVLRDINFEVTSGEVVAILGPSGCGKSTLLRAVGGLDAPDVGSVFIDGTEVNGIDDRCAVAFQEPRLLPWQSIRNNVAIGLPHEASKTDGAHRVDELLELVGLDAFGSHRPREISGGMAQRASLARALARDPGVLLLDEPFGALDALTRLKMQDLLLDIHRAAPATVLLVTHDVDEALQLADRIVVLGVEQDVEDADSGSHPGSTIVQVLNVPGSRPRDRSSTELLRMRSALLTSLGVDPHDH